MGAMSLPLAAQVKVSVSASKQPVETVLEHPTKNSANVITNNEISNFFIKNLSIPFFSIITRREKPVNILKFYKKLSTAFRQ